MAGEIFTLQPRIAYISQGSVDAPGVLQVWAQLESSNGLCGQKFASVIDGIAQFTDLYVSAPSRGLRLVFNCTLDGLSALSDSFDAQVL